MYSTLNRQKTNVAKLMHEHTQSLTVILVHERLVPEGADVHAQHLGGLDHLAETPHERSVHAHQLLAVHLIGLVQNAPTEIHSDNI